MSQCCVLISPGVVAVWHSAGTGTLPLCHFAMLLMLMVLLMVLVLLLLAFLAQGNQCNRTLCFFAHSACELRFPDTSDDAEAAAVDAAAASATATPLPLCASTSSMSAVHPAAAATGSSATLLPQITAQPSSCSNSGLLLPNGMVGMSQASDALMGGGSSFYSGNSFGGMGSFCSQDLPGLGIGCSDPGVLIPGLAVDNSSCLSEPLARVNTDAAALMAATNTNGSSNVAAWLQLAAASQLPASQIRNSIRPPPSVQPQPPQPHSTALFANEIGRGVPDDFSGAAINSNAARAMQQLSVPGANVMGILNSGRARGVDSSADHVAAGFAGLNLQASATGFGAAAGAGLLVDDSSSSSCITSISGDQQQFLAALGLAVGMPQNAGLMVAPGGPGSSQAPGRAGSARAEDLMLLQQNLLRASTTGSMSNGMQNSGGLPTMLPHELQPQVAQVGGSTWLRIG